MAEEVAERVAFRLSVRAASEVTRLSVCGNWQENGWHLANAVDLRYTEESGTFLNVTRRVGYVSAGATVDRRRRPCRRPCARGSRASARRCAAPSCVRVSHKALLNAWRSSPALTQRIRTVAPAPTCCRRWAPVALPPASRAGYEEGSTFWTSPQLSIPVNKLPLRIKFVANGHRSSPNTRPLIWDSRSRVYDAIPADGCAQLPADWKCPSEPHVGRMGGQPSRVCVLTVSLWAAKAPLKARQRSSGSSSSRAGGASQRTRRSRCTSVRPAPPSLPPLLCSVVWCEFEPTPDSSDTGWVSGDGVGAYQLRVGQPLGSAEALVTLESHLEHTTGEEEGRCGRGWRSASALRRLPAWWRPCCMLNTALFPRPGAAAWCLCACKLLVLLQGASVGQSVGQ